MMADILDIGSRQSAFSRLRARVRVRSDSVLDREIDRMSEAALHSERGRDEAELAGMLCDAIVDGVMAETDADIVAEVGPHHIQQMRDAISRRYGASGSVSPGLWWKPWEPSA